MFPRKVRRYWIYKGKNPHDSNTQIPENYDANGGFAYSIDERQKNIADEASMELREAQGMGLNRNIVPPGAIISHDVYLIVQV